MKKFSISKRITALALSLIMVLGLAPIMPTVAAEQEAVNTRVADPVTLDSWKEFFGTSDSFTTEHAGLVWTDKSVTAGASHFGYATEVESGEEKIALSGDKNSFLVSLSAMSSAKNITGQIGKPIDIMLVLSMNSSMYNGYQRTTETVAAMLDSVNETIRQLQERNVNNRVGVTVFYGGQDRNQSKAPSYKLLLPLGRYVHANNEYLSYTASDGKLQTVGVNTDVKNEAGKAIDSISHTHTVTDAAGAYTQQGILSAMEQFMSADTMVPETAMVNKGEARIPVMLLLSGWPPTAATYDYTNIAADAGMGNNTDSIRNPNETDFVTQLTAAYAKEMIDAHYEEKPVFYTLSLGSNISYDVMDPSKTLDNDFKPSVAISGFWDRLIANDSVKIYVKNSPSAWSDPTETATYTVSKTTVSGKTFPSSKAQQYYVDKAFEAKTAVDLSAAFASIVSELTLQSHSYPTQVTGDPSLDGYVSFADKIGEYMSVTEMKGILLGERWYSGKELSKNFVTGGGALGTISNPTALGDELVWSIQQRLGLPNSNTVRTLLALAYQYGQLAYHSDGSYSNYFGWYSDKDGNYLGFWQEGASQAPDNTTFKNKTYLYMGELDGTDGTDTTNMMYITVNLREEIATGKETVIFEVPAALLPTVTYNGEIDSSMLTSLSRDGARQPIRLVYEVSLDEGVDEATLLRVVNDEYINSNKNNDGSINFYTNQFEADGTVGSGKVNTYSHFHPSYGNSQYYYAKSETIYTDQAGTVYEANSEPGPNDTYYRRYEVYVKKGDNLRIETRYQQLTSAETDLAVRRDDGSWYIPLNTVNLAAEAFSDAKEENKTNTLEHSGAFYLDVNGYHAAADGHSCLVGNTLGNNGKITVTPATGIMLSATVDDLDADLTDVSFVYTVSSEDQIPDSLKTVIYKADGDKTFGTLVFTDGKANITLKAEECIIISELPADAEISVTLNAGEDFVPVKVAVDNADQEQTVATVTPQKEHISDVTFTVLPMIDGAIYSISDLTKAYDGEPVVLPSVDRFGEGAITVEYKQKDEPDSAYTATPPSEAGDYFVRVSVAEWQNVRATSATKAFSIIDEIAPTGKIMIDENNFWEKLLNKIAFGLFFNDSKTATVTASDVGSGVKSVEYYIADADLIDDASLTDTEAISALEAAVNGSWATYDKEITLNKNAKNVIYVKITDNVGNVTYISSEGIVLYSNAEAVTTRVSASYKAGENKDVLVNLNGNTVNAIMNGDAVLTAGTHYTVSDDKITLKADYLNTLNAGIYTFTISYNLLGETYVEAEGNVEPATTTFTLSVTPASIENATVTVNGTFTYNGAEKTPDTVVKLNGVTLTKDTDYIVSYADNVNAGTATVTVSGKGNYSGRASGNFEIKQKEICIADVELDGSLTYNGSEQTQNVSVTEGITYEISGNKATNVDTYTLTVTGTGNYTGEVQLKWSIKEAVAEVMQAPTAKQDLVYNKDPQALITAGTAVGGAMQYSLDGVNYSYDIPEATNADTYTVYYKVEGDSNHYGTDAKSFTVTIEKKTVDLSGVKWDYTEPFKYDGLVHGVAIDVSTMPEGASVSNYTGHSSINAGSRQAAVSIIYDDNHKGEATLFLDWEIVNNWTPTEYTVSGEGWMNQDFVITPAGGYKVSLTNTANGEWKDSLTYSEETNSGSVTFYLKNEADGTISLAKTVNYKIDTTDPTGRVEFDERNGWEEFVHNITFGLFYKNEVTVKVTANDNLSGVAKIEYVSSNEAKTLNEVEEIANWTEYNGSFGVSVEDTKQFVYFIRITDNAGNVTYLSTDGAEYDTTLPAISGIENGGVYYGDKVFKATDENFLKIEVDGTDITNTTEGDNEFKIVADNAEHTVTVTDKAGNVTEYTITVYKRYSVTFTDGEGGSYEKEFKYGEVITIPTNEFFEDTFRKTGYTLTEWQGYTEGMTMPLENLTFTAAYTPNDYTVEFDTNGGEAIAPITVTFGEKYGNLPSSAITGLSGGNKNWYLVDANGTVTETNIKNLTLVGTAREHKLFIKRNVLAPNVSIALTVPGGISDGYQYYIPGASQRVLTATVSGANTELLSYTYQWYKDGTPIEGATASVLTLDGNVADSGTYKVEVTATLKDGTGIVVTTSSATGAKEQNVKILHAANTLSYGANGGEGGPQSSYTGGTSLNVSKDEPTREHYDFIGWNTKADGSGDSYKAKDVYVFTEDGGNGGCKATLYAQWKAKEYTVTYMADGQTVSTEKVEYGKDATLPTVPHKDGYVGKWDSEGKNITADTEINAVYTINKYTVTYKADGVVVDTVTVEHGKDATAPAIPEKEGYTQTAPTWDKEGKNITADTEINAVYTINKYTVTYKADGAVVIALEVEHGENVDFPELPKKDGYVGKWDRNNENITSDTVINAVYTEIDNVVPEELKTNDKTDLEDTKKQLEDMLDDNSYTDDDKKDIQDAIDDIDDALKAIGNVEAALELIDKLPDTIKKDDEAAIKAADDAYNALTDYEKSLVDKDAKKALDDAKAALAELKKPADHNSPATGDNSNMFLWIALLFISGGAVITLTVVDRKRRIGK